MELTQFRLDGKVALVTGGNRGIGLAIAKLFGAAGAKVMICGRTETDAVLKLCESDAYQWVQADVMDTATPDKIVQATIDGFGGIDILVNNAGIADHGAFHEFDDDRLAAMMDTNFNAPFRIARSAIKPMMENGEGVILNIGSISADVANKPQKQVAYNASKAGVHQMTKVMAHEYAGQGIRINALAPGYVVTDMTKGGIENEAWNKVWTENTPMGRFGRPEEMANCALFLCSPASSYVTGAILTADGGYTTG
ncbi:MAG: SDR family oxidoreductase [Pseudomonadota bacterium]